VFLHGMSQFFVDDQFVITVYTTHKQSRALANETTVFLRPKDDLLVMGSGILVFDIFFHDLRPMARLVSRS
jgi:hypothetical protein